MEPVRDDNNCFACGKNNPIGLKLEFEDRGDHTFSLLRFGRNYAGWENMVHGGILSTVLDEVMVKSAGDRGFRCVTAELTIRYKKPCETGKEYELTGRVSAVSNKLIRTEGEIRDLNGIMIAAGTAKLFIIDGREGGAE